MDDLLYVGPRERSQASHSSGCARVSANANRLEPRSLVGSSAASATQSAAPVHLEGLQRFSLGHASGGLRLSAVNLAFTNMPSSLKICRSFTDIVAPQQDRRAARALRASSWRAAPQRPKSRLRKRIPRDRLALLETAARP